MNMKIKSIFTKFFGVFMVLAVVLLSAPVRIQAASVTDFSVTLTRNKASTAGNQTILFTTPTGVAGTGNPTIILTYDNSTSVAASLDFEDIDLSYDTTPDGVCETGDTEMTLAAAQSGATMGVVRTSGTVITFTNGSTAIAAGSEVCIQIGTNATTGATGAEQITNGAEGTSTLTLSGGFGDSGVASMSIVDDDQVTVTATVNSAITFDIDTAQTDTGSDDPYSVALGTITTSDTRVSGTTDGINFIWVDLNSNASGGVVVTVANANGTNGLVSTSVPADNINSADGSVADGTEIYGLCIVATSAVTGALDDEGGYDSDTCSANNETNNVQALSTTGETIFDTNGAPIATGRGQIAVNASISGTTVAHADYTDTLTFTATGTF